MKVNKRKNKENSNASDKKKSQKQHTLEEKLEIMIHYVNKKSQKKWLISLKKSQKGDF